MIRIEFNKLIRHKIPDRMQEEGVLVNSKKLENHEFINELHNKLLEEAKEVIVAQGDIQELTQELADVLEVIHTIADEHDISIDDIENARLEKRDINGYFAPENYINYIEVEEDNHRVINYLKDKKRSYKLEC